MKSQKVKQKRGSNLVITPPKGVHPGSEDYNNFLTSEWLKKNEPSVKFEDEDLPTHQSQTIHIKLKEGGNRI